MKPLLLLPLIFSTNLFARDCVDTIKLNDQVSEAYECTDSDLVSVNHSYVNFNGQKKLSKKEAKYEINKTKCITVDHSNIVFLDGKVLSKNGFKDQATIELGNTKIPELYHWGSLRTWLNKKLFKDYCEENNTHYSKEFITFDFKNMSFKSERLERSMEFFLCNDGLSAFHSLETSDTYKCQKLSDSDIETAKQFEHNLIEVDENRYAEYSDISEYYAKDLLSISQDTNIHYLYSTRNQFVQVENKTITCREGYRDMQRFTSLNQNMLYEGEYYQSKDNVRIQCIGKYLASYLANKSFETVEAYNPAGVRLRPGEWDYLYASTHYGHPNNMNPNRAATVNLKHGEAISRNGYLMTCLKGSPTLFEEFPIVKNANVFKGEDFYNFYRTDFQLQNNDPGTEAYVRTKFYIQDIKSVYPGARGHNNSLNVNYTCEE